MVVFCALLTRPVATSGTSRNQGVVKDAAVLVCALTRRRRRRVGRQEAYGKPAKNTILINTGRTTKMRRRVSKSADVYD